MPPLWFGRMSAPARPRRRSTPWSWPTALAGPAKTSRPGLPASKPCSCRSAGTWWRCRANRALTFRRSSNRSGSAVVASGGAMWRRFCMPMALAATRSATLSRRAGLRLISDLTRRRDGVEFRFAATSGSRPHATQSPSGSVPVRFDFPERKGREHVRRIGRRRCMQIGPVDLAEAGEAEKTERARHLVFHEFQHPHDSGLTGGREAVALHAAKPDEVGAKRQRLDDVGAAIDGAVDDDRRPARNRLHHFRQDLGRTAAVIELAAAVIGHVDDLDAVIERDLGVFGGADALNSERDLVLAFHALDRAPVERHLKVAPLHAAAARGNMTFGEIAFAPAVMSGVDRDAKRGVIVLDGALDVIVGPGGVTSDIKLKHPQRIGRRLGDILQSGFAHRTEHMSNPELGRGSHDRLGAAGVKALQRADRTEHHRQAQFVAEHLDRWTDFADIAQHTRSQRD